jgi:diguanylate cyclase (GGDEF)-like protein/PAS domain S-box-containing protein
LTQSTHIDRKHGRTVLGSLDPELARRALDATREGVVIADATERGFPVVWASTSFEEITGYTADEVTGRSCALLQGPDSDPFAIRQMSCALASGRPARTIIRNYRRDGTPFWNEVSLTPVRDDEMNLTHYAATVTDVTEVVEADRRTAYLATHDELTGLPNSSLLGDRLEQLNNRLARREGIIAVVMVGLDDLKAINETLGHVTGDQLLKLVPTRIHAVTRASDTIGRVGGNRFVVLCEDIQTEHGYTQLAERIIAAFEEPFTIGEEVVRCSASVGLAMSKQRRPEPQALLKEADSAWRRASADAGGRFEIFNVAMRERIQRRASLTKDLRDALTEESLSLAFQPVVDIGAGSVRGLEALARWNHPSRGQISPEEFIPLAEETGQILELGRILFRQACEEFAAANLPGKLGLSINLSIRQLADRHLVSTIDTAVREAGLDFGQIAVEITETALTSDLQSAASRLWELRELGIAVHLDDFGAGFASLGHLRRFPVDTLKIDRSFIGGLGGPSQDATLVSAILPMSRALGLNVVAEGVETDTQLAHLSSLGCRLVQGFLFARPSGLDDVRALIRSGRLTSPSPAADSRTGGLQAAYREALQTGNLRQALDTVRTALAEGTAPIDVQTMLIGPALRWISGQREAGHISAADADHASSISERALNEILEMASSPAAGSRGKVLVGALSGAQPAAGPRTTAELLSKAGYEPLHLGTGVTGTILIEAIRKHRPVAIYITAAPSDSTWGLADLVENVGRVAPNTLIVVGGLDETGRGIESSGAVLADSPSAALELIEAGGASTV